MWKLIGFDPYDETFYPLGRFQLEANARAAARERLRHLERTHPTIQSGGQTIIGNQDRVYIEHPDGQRERITE